MDWFWCGCRIIYYRHKRACNYVEEEDLTLELLTKELKPPLSAFWA